MEEVLCSFGCGKTAKYFFKSGNACCEQSPNSCEVKRRNDSEKKKGEFKGTPAWKIDEFRYNPWNKGVKGCFSLETRKKISNSLKGKSTGKGSTTETENQRRQNISKKMKENPNAGGLRQGSGRGKKGWYKGYWCDSSWELAWVIYHIDNGFVFYRNKEYFTYTYKKEEKKYYPDFVMDGVYYEIKGRKNFSSLDGQTKEKIKQFKGNLVVLYENDIKPFIKYCIDKYGKNYINLYENSSNSKKCEICEKELYRTNKSGYCHKCYYKFNLIKKDKFVKIEKKIDNYITRRKTDRPTYDILMFDIKQLGYRGAGKKYGVSDNTIRKWKTFYEKYENK